MKSCLVVTTINPPNEVFAALAKDVTERNMDFIVIGDEKTPANFVLKGADYLSLERQGSLFPSFATALPTRHYARKNVGYLSAAQAGAELIFETDDDNYPRSGFLSPPPDFLEVRVPATPRRWINPLSYFTTEDVWPRGLPLEEIHGQDASLKRGSLQVRPGIIQYLADENPDVDAVFRLTRSLPLSFEKAPPILIPKGIWCPFNSQATVFTKKFFPLLYLPSFCSFRMTDIWRSLIAVRCLWEEEEFLIYAGPEVWQERNPHDLLRDFDQEVPGYLNNNRIAMLLEGLMLTKGDILGNIRLCYESLVAGNVLPEKELNLLNLFQESLKK
jgi:hypothetical protein